jgi:hypothetical protein
MTKQGYSAGMEGIGDREWVVLKTIIEFQKERGVTPTLRELLSLVNARLPKRRKGAQSLPALSGQFQINRSIDKLREVKLLIKPDTGGLARLSRSFIPTEAGVDYYKKRCRKERTE